MRIEVDPKRPDPRVMKVAGAAIRRGELVIFPTETFYGIGANALDPRAVRMVFALKGRPASKPLIVLIAERNELSRLAREIPSSAHRLASRFWPGPLTMIFKKHRGLPRTLTAGGDTIAVRLSPHPIARALIRAAGVPLTAPSANPSGKKPPTTAAEVVRAFRGRRNLPLVLDAGATPLKKPSTILDLTRESPRILRQGAVPATLLAPYLAPAARRHAKRKR